MNEDAFVIVSQYVILPLVGVITTNPGSPPADLAAKAASGSGSDVEDGENGNLNESKSFEDREEEDVL